MKITKIFLLLLLSFQLLSSESEQHKKLLDVSPEELEKLTKHKPGLFKETIKEFPLESLYFYAAQGIVLTTTLLTRMNHNPLAVEQFLKTPTDPVAHISFFSFMLAHRASNRALGLLLDPRVKKVPQGHLVKSPIISPESRIAKTIRPLQAFIGMGIGMAASHIVGDLLYDPNLKKCALEVLDGLEKDSCNDAYTDWIVSGKLTRYFPDFAILATSVITGAISFELGKTAILKALKLPASAFKYAGIYGKLGQFSTFLLSDHLLRKVFYVPLGQVLYQGHLFSSDFFDFGLLSSIKKDIKDDLSEGDYQSVIENWPSMDKERSHYYQVLTYSSSEMMMGWTEKVASFQEHLGVTARVHYELSDMLKKVRYTTDPRWRSYDLYSVSYDKNSKDLQKLWVESRQDEFNLFVNHRQLNIDCLGPGFNTPLCSYLEYLKKQHLVNLSKQKVPEFYEGLYIKSKQKQINDFKSIQESFRTGTEIKWALELAVKNYKAEVFFRKNSGRHFSLGPWQQLLYKIVGHQDVDLWDEQFLSIKRFLHEDDYVKEYVLERNRFELPKLFSPGEAHLVWTTYQVRKSAHNEFYDEKRYSNLAHAIVSDIFCGKDQAIENRYRQKIGFHHPRLVKSTNINCSKNRSPESFDALVSELKKIDISNMAAKKWNEINDELANVSQELLKEIKSEYVDHAIKDEMKVNNAWFGIDNLRDALVSDFNYYLGLLPSEGLNDALFINAETIFQRALDQKGDEARSTLYDLKMLIGQDTKTFANNLLSIANESATGPITDSWRSSLPTVEQIDSLGRDFGHFKDGERLSDQDVLNRLLAKIDQIIYCSIDLDQSQKVQLTQSIHGQLKLYPPNLAVLYDIENMVKNYKGSIKFLLTVQKWCTKSPSVRSDEQRAISLIFQGVEGLLSYVGWRASQVNDLLTLYEKFTKKGLNLWGEQRR